MATDADRLYAQLRSVVQTTNTVLSRSQTRMADSEYSYAEFGSNVADVNSAIIVTQEVLDALNGADGEEFRLWLNGRLIGVSKTLSAWQSDVQDLVDAFKAFNATVDASITALESASGYIQGEQWGLNVDGTGTFTPRVFTSVQTTALQSDIDDIMAAVTAVIVG